MDKQLNIYDAIDVISNPKYEKEDRVKLSTDICQALKSEFFPIMEEIAKTSSEDSPHKDPKFTMRIFESALRSIAISNGDENGLEGLIIMLKGIIRELEIAKEADRM